MQPLNNEVKPDLFKTHPENPAPNVVRNIALVDMDGTLLKFDYWRGTDHYGDPIPGAADALKELKDMGLIVIIWSTRGDQAAIRKALDERGFAGLYDYINENPFQPPDASQKLMNTVSIDDRAVGFRGDWRITMDEVVCLLTESPLL